MHEVLCATTRGARHIQKGIPSQDWGMVTSNDRYRIFSMADGHSDPNCPRSQDGAQIACMVACEKMKEFSQNLSGEGWEPRLLSEEEQQEELIRQLITSIVTSWTERVLEDSASRPLTEEERAGCRPKYAERYARGENLEHAYGTTLIAGLMTDTYLLLIQQGDGKCVLFHQDGFVSEPIPWDDRCFLNITTSMCDQDAIQAFRYCVINLKEDPVAACFAASDGVDDSLGNAESLYLFYESLLKFASENDVPSLEMHLKEVLADFSKNGSGDDVTIAGIIDPDSTKELLPTFEHNTEIQHQKNVISRMDELLSSLDGMGKLTTARTRYEKANAVVKSAENEMTAAVQNLSVYSIQLEEFYDFERTRRDIASKIRQMLCMIVQSPRLDEFENHRMRLQQEAEKASQTLVLARNNLQEAEREYMDIHNREKEYRQEKQNAERKLFLLQGLSSE